MTEVDIIWQQCLSLLKDQYGLEEYNTWFKPLKIRLEHDKLQILANNRLIYGFIKNKYWNKIDSLLGELSGGLINEFIVSTPLTSNNNASSGNNTKTADQAEVIVAPDVNLQNHNMQTASSKTKSSKKLDKELLESLHQSTKLNPNYNFDSLVRGNSNQLAYAIGMHVTRKPGSKNHNPLFIYGGVGLGKTHLMQAIGNEIYAHNPKARIRYLHANDYIQDVVKASMRQGFDELKKYYNSLDLLLMDDIQFIAGDKTKTQEEFFYTFNTLLEKGKQVIMTCDTYPRNINNLNERLVSRFASGLTVEIQPPELEMRVAILKCKAESIKLQLDDDVAFFIAQNIKSNVRELEGALNKVVYHAQFSGKRIDTHIAKEALMDILAIEGRAVSIDDIQKTVCDFYKLRISDLLSTKRTQIIARPRQIAMTLSKELTQYSLPAIGKAFGGRDHTTVIHAQKIIGELRKSDERIEKEYNLLIQMLRN